MSQGAFSLPPDVEREVLCPVCGKAKLAPVRQGSLELRAEAFGLPEILSVDLYECPHCRKLELFRSFTDWEIRRRTPEVSPVERFEQTFGSYADQRLRAIIDGSGYVPDAKQAARNLLEKRCAGEAMLATESDGVPAAAGWRYRMYPAGKLHELAEDLSAAPEERRAAREELRRRGE